MFDNSRFFDMDEALIRVLNLLANVADVNDVKKYIFDSTDHTFRPRKEKGIKSRRKFFASRAKKQHNKVEVNWEIIATVTFSISIIILILLTKLALQVSSKTPSFWTQLLVLLMHLSLASLLTSTISLFALAFIRNIESNQPPGQRIIKNAVEDVIAYQAVIREIYAVVQNSQQTLENAESVIKHLIDEIQIREKKDSYLLSIMFFGFLVLALCFVFPIHLFETTLQNNIVFAIGVTGTSIIPVIRAFIESGSQSKILKLRKCLFLLKQAQARANNSDQQVIPIESTKLRPRFGSAKGLIQMSDDFDTPLTDFDDYKP